MQNSYTVDPIAKDLISKLSLDDMVVPNFTLKQGLLRYKNRIWIGKDPGVYNHIIVALHCSTHGGHSGVPLTINEINKCLCGKV
jgi:hypothetical protein